MRQTSAGGRILSWRATGGKTAGFSRCTGADTVSLNAPAKSAPARNTEMVVAEVLTAGVRDDNLNGGVRDDMRHESNYSAWVIA